MLQGGLGRLGEASGRLVGSAWEMIGGGFGRLGEACSVHARPLWGSLGGLGRLGAAWGMLGNASGRLGECLGMLRGGSGRLGEAWGRLGECFVNASGKLGEAWGGMLGNASGRLGPLWASASQPKGCFWSTFLHFYGPASQPAKRMTGLFYPRSASLGIARDALETNKKHTKNMLVLAWNHHRRVGLAIPC